MLFSSYEFLLAFLPLTLVGFFLLLRLAPSFAAKTWLVGASLVFYAWWDWRYLPLLIGSVLVNFALGRALSGSSPRRLPLLWGGIVLNVGLLAYFKFVGFFVLESTLLSAIYEDPASAVLPLAISYFTFQQVGFLVDCYKKKAQEYSLLNYSLFITFFPQLLMGPIVHHRDLVPQFARARFVIHWEGVAQGLFLFTIGLAKKLLIADPMLEHVEHLDMMVVQPSIVYAWYLALGYLLTLYFDLSAYADMAVGIGLLFNIKIPFNFNSPLKARNIADFWSRWHITLSQFLSDYIFKPISRLPSRKSIWRPYIIPLGILTTFVASGLWHGEGWHYVVWGAAHGLGVIAAYLMGKRKWALPLVLAWPLMFLFLLLARTLAASGSLSNAWMLYQSMFNAQTFTWVNFTYIPGMEGPGVPGLLVYLTVGLAIALFAPNSQSLAASAAKRPWLGAIVGIVAAASFALSNGSREFAYFQF